MWIKYNRVLEGNQWIHPDFANDGRTSEKYISPNDNTLFLVYLVNYWCIVILVFLCIGIFLHPIGRPFCNPRVAANSQDSDGFVLLIGIQSK